ncbi:MAG: heavy-metal-associated domain-containing protein [Polyangiaceae bacterium]|nr:heavy-metal-associated domain-containing protein [Polyangiaceae bacterium]
MQKETVIEVQGMTCGSCVRHVGGALRKVEGVSNVDVRLEAGEAVVTHEGVLSAAELVAAVEEEGYTARARV